MNLSVIFVPHVYICFCTVGHTVLEDHLEEAAEQSGVLEVKDDFLEQEFRIECEPWIRDVNDIEPEDCKNPYLYKKQNFILSSS